MNYWADIMNKSTLMLWVEGVDDERFFEKIIIPTLNERYGNVTTLNHSQMKNAKINNFIKSIKSCGYDYIFVVDIDLKTSVDEKKKEIKGKYPELEENNIFIIIKEIESWYLAGLGKKYKKIKLSQLDSTDHITKEMFNSKIPKGLERIEFLQDILNSYSIDSAKSKNKSFKQFYDTYLS